MLLTKEKKYTKTYLKKAIGVNLYFFSSTNL